MKAARWLISARVALIVGIGGRLWFYFLHDSFWRDESKLMLHVAQNSFSGLVGSPEYGPIPILWLYRLLYLSGAGGELPLRAASLIASILALVLFVRLAQRILLDQRAFLFATWLLALAPGVILFAALAKVYSLDLLMAVVLLSMAATPLTNSDGSHKIAWLTAMAAIAPWLSYPSLFVVGGIGIGLIIRRRVLGWGPVVRFAAATTISVIINMLLILYHIFLSVKTVMATYLKGPWGVLWTFAQIFYAYLGPQNVSYAFVLSPGYSLGPAVFGVAILILLGLRESRRQYGWAWTVALAGPLLPPLVASALKLYIPYGRLFLFAIPGLYLLAGFGATLFLREIKWPKLAPYVLILLVLPCGISTLQAYRKPDGGVRGALKYIADRQQAGDLVFCDTYAASTIVYYRLLGDPSANAIRFGLNVEKWIEYKVDHRMLKPEVLLPLIPRDQRVWLVAETLDYSRSPAIGILPYWQEVEKRLAASRKILDSYTTDRAQARCFSPEQY